MIESPTKIFIDVSGRGHLEPLISADESDAITNFYLAFAYQTPDQLAHQFFFDSTLPISSSLKIASVGEKNTGMGKYGYYACDHLLL